MVSVFESTRLALAKLTAPGREALARGLLQAAQASAHALAVRRVGIWFLSANGQEIVCAAMWDEAAPGGSSGQRLDLSKRPAYAAALASRRVVLAHDARSAVETSELRDDYLVPNGITSLLDAPIYHDGEVVGVACHEHVGPARTWTDRERDLSASLADVIALLLEQAGRADAEAALRLQQERSAKLERQVALARMCAGIAHDFNNVLGALRLQLDVIRQHHDSPGLEEDVAAAITSTDAGQGIVKQLLSYARATESQPRALNLTRAVTERRPLLAAAAGATHELVLDLTGERLVTEIDPALLDQILLNLITNAKEAMASPGRMTLSLRGDADWVTLAVRDEGVGIDAAVRERIFEPFFTTKGTGTGLGLSTVLSIVERAGGKIEVDSHRGVGTTVTIHLPRIDG